MWGLKVRSLIETTLLISICGLSAQSLFSQEFLTGTITYISKDNAFMDLGKKDGIQIGDSVKVVHNGNEIGMALVSQTSGSSSALDPVKGTTIAWQIGDGTKMVRPLVENKTEAIPAPMDSSQVSPIVTQVFLDSSAYQTRTRSTASLDRDRFAPGYSGYLSARYDNRGGDPKGENIQSASLYGKFTIQDLAIRHLSASVYFRANGISTSNNFDSNIYSVMLQYKRPGGHFDYLGGRMYHPQFSMLGTVDGVGASWHSERRMISALAGLEAPIYGYNSGIRRIKMGILENEKFGWGDIKIGNITEIQSGDLARNYLILGSSLKVKGGMRVRAYSEFDLDPFDQSSSQALVSLTRFDASLNKRIWRSISGNFRYNYRENVQSLLDTVDTDLNLSARHSLSANLSWRLRSSLGFSTQASYRSDPSGRSIQMYGLTMNAYDFISESMSLNAGLMVMLSYLSEGGRIHASIGKTILPWLDVELYDEVFLYRILGETSFRTRHLPEISLALKVPGLNRLRVRTRFEQENGDIFYRVSLSAIRQF